MKPQNSKFKILGLNDEPEFYNWPIFEYQDIAENLTMGQFARNLKNGYMNMSYTILCDILIR